jgi:hypothetical protein
MVTNYPQQLSNAATTEVAPQQASEGLVGRLANRVGQVICGLHGHDSVLHFEANRVMMRCTSCGHDTPGWEISGKGPRVRYEGDAHRHLLNSKPRLVLRKSA